jgi:UDP-glucose 4-epimerase
MENLKGRNIIVTGGAGFIGSNLVERLAPENNVYVIDNLNTGSLKNLEAAQKTGNVKFIQDDSKNISKHNINADLIIHLGMYSSSPMYKKNPNLLNEVIEGVINILEYAKKNKATLVFASTSSIYSGITPPHKESIVPPVTDYYTEGRILAERLSELYAKLFGVNAAAMRFFSVYGRHEEAKKEYANLVTQFIWAIKKGERPVIYGDGLQRRDFVFVDDVVDALIKVADIKGFDIFNVGTGRNYSLNELVDKINKSLGTDVKAEYVKMPTKNYVMENLADTSKAEKLIKFKAKISLDEGISKLLNGQ